MFIFNNYLSVLRKYFTFKGRASRSEFWWFVFADVIILLSIYGVEAQIIGNDFSLSFMIFESNYGHMYDLLTVIPALAVSVRRLHDVNKEAVWFLVPIFNLYLLAKEGDRGQNRFG